VAVTSWITFTSEQNDIKDETPVLTRLWPDAGYAYSVCVEWNKQHPARGFAAGETVDDSKVEKNYCQTVSREFYSDFKPSEMAEVFKNEWHQFLHSIENVLAHGERHLETKGETPLSYCAGIGRLGLTLDNSQLVWLREPRLLQVRNDPRVLYRQKLLAEFSLRRVRD
jgi:hypothetical protein